MKYCINFDGLILNENQRATVKLAQTTALRLQMNADVLWRDFRRV